MSKTISIEEAKRALGAESLQETIIILLGGLQVDYKTVLQARNNQIFTRYWNSEEKPSLKQLAKEYGLCERTIRRIIFPQAPAEQQETA